MIPGTAENFLWSQSYTSICSNITNAILKEFISKHISSSSLSSECSAQAQNLHCSSAEGRSSTANSGNRLQFYQAWIGAVPVTGFCCGEFGETHFHSFNVLEITCTQEIGHVSKSEGATSGLYAGCGSSSNPPNSWIFTVFRAVWGLELSYCKRTLLRLTNAGFQLLRILIRIDLMPVWNKLPVNHTFKIPPDTEDHFGDEPILFTITLAGWRGPNKCFEASGPR